MSIGYISGGALDREGKERAEDVDICASSSGAIVLVRKRQVKVVASQLIRRCDPAETPGGVSPVRSRSEVGQLPRVGGNRLSGNFTGPNGAILFDRSDFRVGTQIVQIIVGELSGVTIDEFVLVDDVAWGGRDFDFGGVDVGSERHPLLEGDDVTARDGAFSLRNSEEGCHWGKVP